MRRIVVIAAVGALSSVLAFAACSQRGEEWVERWFGGAGGELAWPDLRSCRLTVDLTTPGRFSAVAELDVTNVTAPRIALLLNDGLVVRRAEWGGAAVDVERGPKLDSRYFGEGRVVFVDVGGATHDAAASHRVVLAYDGAAEFGATGPDWRGILLVDTDDARMSEQSIFYPQVPLGLDTPRVAECRFDVDVVAPAAWEVFVPLPPVDATSDEPTTGAGTKRHRFVGERTQDLSILGGVRVRSETRVGGLRVVTLLTAAHAGLSAEFAREIPPLLDAYVRRFGAIESGTLGVVEIRCRDSSFNWMSDGVVALDTGAFGRGVPVATLAHELAHLWWGQAVAASGDGERFLTEGLAEYAAWSELEDTGRGDLVMPSIDVARRTVADLVERGASAALIDASFGRSDYLMLAYEKGPLVLRALRGQLPPGSLDAALARLVERGRTRLVTIDDFEACLREATGLEVLAPYWLRQAGDVDLEAASLTAHEGGGASLTVRTTPIGTQRVDVAGTPLALQFGGVGWVERRTVSLRGEATELELESAGREVRFARLDPDGVWPRVPKRRTIVARGERIASSEPAQGETTKLGGTRVVVDFTGPLGPLDAARFSRSQIAGRREHELDVQRVTVEDEGRRLVVETRSWRPDRSYRLDLSALVDRDGLPLADDVLHFRTAPSEDRQGPRVVRVRPESGSVVAPGGLRVEIEFDEPMVPQMGFRNSAIADQERAGKAFPNLVDGGTWRSDERTIVYELADLERGVKYALPIGQGFRDVSGNAAQEFIWTIEVAPGD
ncbi:MAG: Ig-like domain-containing protein [Planctomycetes bacterium]|nr:Ig-like domain-containing protein [Planctomycetota bacterium]